MVGKKGAVKAGKKDPVEVVERKKSTLSEQIKDLEDEIAKTKYNKRTQRAVGLLKAKLAMLKERQVSRGGSGKASGDDRFSVRKSGDGTVLLLGFPSVGKSTLLNVLTAAKSETGAYAFTTLSAVPGLMKYKYAKIQIIDVPGIVEGASSGRGRGAEVLSLMRSADLVLLVIDALQPGQYESLLRETYNAKFRLDKKAPNVIITRKEKGGLSISSLVKLEHLERETIEAMCREFKLINADILFREDVDVDGFLDVLEKNRIYIPSLTVITKSDLVSDQELARLKRKIKPDLCISATTGHGIPELRDAIFTKLDLIRIYLKEVGKKPDMDEPLIMFRDCSIEDVCSKLHRDFVKNFRFARLWGKGAKFDGQTFNKMDKTLCDGDVLELHIK